jgi:dTDP-4-amino-4,6-dideoxygalactose transaminase
MPNLNAALGLAQLEQLPDFLANKRSLAQHYQAWAQSNQVNILCEPPQSRSNFWLNTLLLDNQEQRDAFLAFSNEHGIMTRPLWNLMVDLPMYRHSQHDGLLNSRQVAACLVNIPSSAVNR